MKKIIIVFSMMLASFLSLQARAADVTVKWQEPSKFTDIDPADQEQDKFEANLFRSFDNIFIVLAQKLPDDFHWKVTVTDLDLAGEVRPNQITGRPMREIKTSYRPAISFEYQLLDAQNNLIKKDKVDLRDPMFMSRSPRILEVNTKPFPYETFMINQWFEEQQNQKILPSK